MLLLMLHLTSILWCYHGIRSKRAVLGSNREFWAGECGNDSEVEVAENLFAYLVAGYNQLIEGAVPVAPRPADKSKSVAYTDYPARQ
jgi:hypothetical protein